jgi:SAM-dependent methyltransferase
MSQTSEAMEYYQRQRGQKKYMDALLKLSSPAPYDVVLVIEKGSATASIFLGDRVKKVYAVEPNGDAFFIKASRENVDELLAQREFLPHFNVNFMGIKPEDIALQFPKQYFDTVVFWGSLHHFQDYEKVMEEAQKVCRPGGKLIIFDGFFPEPIRDFWEMASTIHDPTTVRHHTYFEYMEMLRRFKFKPITVLPFRHPNIMDKWLTSIKGEDNIIAEKIKTFHPGKYDAWLEKAINKGLRQTLRQEILDLDEEKKAFMDIKAGDDGQWEFTYDTFVLLAEREVA